MHQLLCQAFLLSLVSFIQVGDCSGYWDALNETVGGRLYSATPFSLPCFSEYNGQAHTPDPARCASIQANYGNSTFRAQFYSGFMNSQDEICSSNVTDQCELNTALPTDPSAYSSDISCNQGSLPQYYVEVKSVEDVQAAFVFSKKTGVRLSIKNSGHDYLSRSSLKGSLALWTRKVAGLRREEHYVPEGCYGIEGIDTITTAAGTNSDEVYRFADKHNVTFVGGYAPSIGVAGGWSQGGGHSVLSPILGLGIDRTVQFKVVTPDGEFRVANACQNVDLFWALKGGGGGTFGLVVETTHRVDPVVPLSVAYIKYNQTATNIGGWLEILVDNGLQWAQEGWGGHLVASNLISVNLLLNLSQATESMAAAANFAKANNGSALIETLPSWYSFYKKYVIANEAAVGLNRFLPSRLIPASLFETSDGRSKLLSFLNYLVSIGLSPYIPATTPYLYPWQKDSTSATPAWRTSLWELGMGGGWAYNSTMSERQAEVSHLLNLTTMAEELTPGSGAYVNEAFPWTVDWQEAWWGDNYPRLLEIKKRYDPDGLLICWKCVGFEESMAVEKFPCFSGLGL